jgi:hypothetical protein
LVEQVVWGIAPRRVTVNDGLSKYAKMIMDHLNILGYINEVLPVGVNQRKA